MPGSYLRLAEGFPTVAPADWVAAVERAVRGRSLDDLATTTPDGIRIDPLYTSSTARPGLPGLSPFTRGATPTGSAGRGWAIRQPHLLAAPDVNDAVLADLEGGATEVLLQVHDAADLTRLDGALRGVHLELAPVVLAAGPHGIAAARALEARWDEAVSGADRAGALRIDPLGACARHGVLPRPLDEMYRELADLAGRSAQWWPEVTTVGVDTSPYAEAGCSAAVELAVSMATAVAYLRALTGAGLGIDAACREIEFTYAVGTDQFGDIAKLRAARRLWSRVTEACGGSAAQRQHATTVATMYTRLDPWVNLLRATVACFSAAVGGAGSVTVLPFDSALGVPEGFARRIARNTQVLLAEESRVGAVVDPAGGSWYVEELTDELAARGWARFQEIEEQGGMLAALRSGRVQSMIGAQARACEHRIATREQPLTGVSEFAHLDEQALERAPTPVVVVEPAVSVCEPLERYRPAAGFEQLRTRADLHRPTVFLAELGPPERRADRATWAANAFEAGGIRALGSDGHLTRAELVDAFRASGARLAVLCGPDDAYDEMVPQIAGDLKAAGCCRLYLVGSPDRVRDPAVDEHIGTGTDLIAALTRALDAAAP